MRASHSATRLGSIRSSHFLMESGPGDLLFFRFRISVLTPEAVTSSGRSLSRGRGISGRSSSWQNWLWKYLLRASAQVAGSSVDVSSGSLSVNLEDFELD